MKPVWIAVLVMACAAQAQQGREQAPVGTDARAAEIIRELKLTVLPKESGYLGIIGVTPQTVSVGGRMLAVQSQNYYMLTRERPINYLHRLEPADTHVLIEGGRWTTTSSTRMGAWRSRRWAWTWQRASGL